MLPASTLLKMEQTNYKSKACNLLVDLFVWQQDATFFQSMGIRTKGLNQKFKYPTILESISLRPPVVIYHLLGNHRYWRTIYKASTH